MPSKQEKMKAVSDILKALTEIIEDKIDREGEDHVGQIPAIDLIDQALELYKNFLLEGDQ